MNYSVGVLNPDVIKDSSIGGSKLKENSISISNIDSIIASKSYVDTAIDDITANYAIKTYVDGLVGDINNVLESIIAG